ncbi:MFS transporter [Nonomuraea sp. MCN248]|uniref:MFS transporter n=1 Tax=Nonomuraea corallina TaxID=2989783 RepID=A0ABT4SG20_9ACTN|nr:MFS transporter [Nonomuraea corallina]MDA0636152.1 MFS transporter [Nonomuraea corallina]
MRQSPVVEVGAYPVARKPARGRGTLLRLVGAGVMFTVMADTTATTLAVGLMQHGDAGNTLPLSDLLWLTSAAFVPIAALLATAGRWADLFGRRRVLVIGLVIFVLGGLATLTVPDWPMVLAARAAQGVGAAAMIPASLAVLLGELPENQRRGAIALWSSASGLGCLLMQAGGGWLATGFGWRALFAPVVVTGMLLLLATTWLPPGLPARRDGAPRTRPDMLGAVLLTLSIGAMVLAISKATTWGMTCAYLAGGAVVTLALALLRARRHRVPAVDLTLWRRPGFGWGWLATWGFGVLSYGLLALQPLYLLHLGFPMLEVALWLTPTSVAVAVTAWLGGKFVRKLGPYGLIYVGATVCGGSCVVALAQSGPTLWGLAASVGVGVGVGALAPGTSMATTLAAQPHQYASAVGAAVMSRMVGGALGVATVSVVIGHPFMAGPMGGLSSALAVCVAVSVLVGTIALMKMLRMPHATGEVMVLVPRRMLLELRTQLATVAAEADALLPAQPAASHPAVPPQAVPPQVVRGQAHAMRPGSQPRVHGGTRLARTSEGLSTWQ